MSFSDNINQMAVSDLLDDNRVPPEDIPNQTQGQAVVVAGEEAPAIENEAEVAAAISQLENYQTAIATNEDGVTKVRDMNEIVSSILASESVSRADAEQIRKAYPEDFDSEFHLNEFTEVPTRVGFESIRKFVERSIGQQEEKNQALLNRRSPSEESKERVVGDFETIERSMELVKSNILELAKRIEDSYTALSEQALCQLKNINAERYAYHLQTKDDLLDLRTLHFGKTPTQSDVEFNLTRMLDSNVRRELSELSKPTRGFSKLYVMAARQSSANYVSNVLENYNFVDVQSMMGTDFDSQSAMLGTLARGLIQDFVANKLPTALEDVCKKLAPETDQTGDILAAQHHVVEVLLVVHAMMVDTLVCANLFKFAMDDFEAYIHKDL